MEPVFNKDTILLSKLAKLNNFVKPYSGFVHQGTVTKTTFPVQDSSKLLSEKRIYYRDKNKCVLVGEEFESDHYAEHTNVLIIRYDLEDPYVFMGIDNDGRIFVGDTRTIDNEETPILLYPEQQYKFYAISVQDVFRDMKDHLDGLVIRCDDAHPAYAVIMEYMSENLIRFVTCDEVLSKVNMRSIVNNPELYKKELDIKELINRLLNEEGYNIYGTTIN